MNRTEIPFNKTKCCSLIFFSVLFVILGYWMFNLSASEIASQRRYNDPFLMHAVALGCMIMGIFGAISLTKTVFSDAPGLIFDANGLTDNTSAVTAGFFRWVDIKEFKVGTIKKQRLLYVVLKNPEFYISQFGLFKRCLLRLNMKLGESPVSIGPSILAIDFDQLLSMANGFLAEHG